MTSSSSHTPMHLALAWYKIRDMLFGQNEVSRNIPLALQLAASCDHPEARWLNDVCAGKSVETDVKAKEVFLAQGENDARALCFAWMCGARSGCNNMAPLRRSAELGYAFAQSLIAQQFAKGKQCFQFAQLAAAQEERDGFYWLGVNFAYGHGCEKDWDRAKHNLLIASDFGHAWACIELALLFDESDPNHWRHLCVAAARDLSYVFLRGVSNKSFESRSKVINFLIGRALRGNVNVEMGKVFNVCWENLVAPANQAISFYESQLAVCKLAINEWTKVGIRLKVGKDIRKLVGQMIWDSREEALYESPPMQVEHASSPSRLVTESKTVA